MSSTRDPNNPYSTYQVGLGVTAYELDFWGRVRSLKDAALDNYLSTQAARDSTQISLVSQVAQAWLSYSFATANLKLADQTLKSQLDAYNLNKNVLMWVLIVKYRCVRLKFQLKQHVMTLPTTRLRWLRPKSARSIGGSASATKLATESAGQFNYA